MLMIVGIGNDLTDLDRLEKIVRSPSGLRFITRVLTSGEILQLERRLEEDIRSIMEGNSRKMSRLIEYTGGRFAAKEAVVKALGCGIGGKVGFQDISILPDEQGKPICTLSEAALLRLSMSKDAKIHVSITHAANFAAAYAVVEQHRP
jgi:holo-[acyl-carrier protein] synthase